MIELTDKSTWKDGWQTECGYPVEIFCDDLSGDYPYGGKYYRSGYWQLASWRGDHVFDASPTREKMDLVPRPVKGEVEIWLNVYPPSARDYYYAYETQQAADHGAGRGRIACVHVVVPYEEGEGL